MVFADMSSAVSLFAQQNKAGGGDGGLAGLLAVCGIATAIFVVVLSVLFIVIWWKIFSKAGQPGWAAIVPFYNQWIIVTEICKKEPLWFILALVPIGNIISAWVVSMELAKKFGKSDTFGIGIFFASPIFLAILAFGDAKYVGRSKRPVRDFDDEDEDDYEDERPRRRR